MKARYFPDTDTLHLELSSATAEETREIGEHLFIDTDKTGRIVGITIEHAREGASAPNFSYELVESEEGEQEAGPDGVSRRKSA